MEPHPVRDCLEILYFLSGIVVAVAAIVGLYQLVLTKRASQMNAKRAAFALATEQCQIYLNQVIPLINALNDKLDGMKIESFGTSEIHIEEDGVKFSVKIKQLTDKQNENLTEPTLAVYNALEAFSVNFTSRVAAESVAFATVGRTFCNSVELLLPELVPLSQSGYFKNTVRLFALWYPRLKKNELEQKKLALQRQCDEIKDVRIKAMGT
jgi:hypothetical protein